MNGPFAPPNFMVNMPTPHCLSRDFVPWIINQMADPKLVKEVLAQPDYTSFARMVEKTRSFDPPNIHASGHFGVGGILGTMGNAAESPGGESLLLQFCELALTETQKDPVFYLHHGNIDRIFWEWQQKDLKTRLNQVGGPIEPFDYSGKNVTLDFKINIGALAGDATLKELLDTRGGRLCYTY
jgi:tyrosinase